MRINGNKFDKALHHPVYTIQKIERLRNSLIKTMENMAKCYGQIETIMKDIALYRQELLGSIKDEEDKSA